MRTPALPDGSYCHVVGKGGSCVHGLAADQVYILDALLAAYQVSGQSRELARAGEAAQVILKEFRDAENGVIKNAKAPENDTAAGRWLDGVEAYFDGETPSVQGVAARDFAIFNALAPDHGFDQQSAALLGHAPVSIGAALMMATVGRAIAERVHGDVLVVVDGSPNDGLTLPLLNAAQSTYRPGKVLAWLDPSQSSPGIGPLAASQLLAPDSERHDAFAFVCTANVCTDRVSTPKELSGLINTSACPSPATSSHLAGFEHLHRFLPLPGGDGRRCGAQRGSFFSAHSPARDSRMNDSLHEARAVATASSNSAISAHQWIRARRGPFARVQSSPELIIARRKMRAE